jgi:hypothetical protein
MEERRLGLLLAGFCPANAFKIADVRMDLASPLGCPFRPMQESSASWSGARADQAAQEKINVGTLSKLHTRPSKLE